MTLLKVNHPLANLHIVGIYRSKSKVTIARFLNVLKHLLENRIGDANVPLIILGDFNFNLLENALKRNVIYKYLTEERKCVQVVTGFTTDYKAQIDHIYTNLAERIILSGILESYFNDHKPVFISIK